MLAALKVEQKRISVHVSGQKYSSTVQLRRVSDNWIFFLHGWGGKKEGFDEVFSRPEFLDYSICALDFLGFGASDKPRDFSYDLADQAQVVCQIAQALNAKNVYLVGHSMGGGVGLLACEKLGGRLRMFVNVEGNLVSTDTAQATRKLVIQPYMLFRWLTFPMMKLRLRISKRADYRAWAAWFASASPWATHQSAKTLARWSDSDELLPLFKALSHKAYVYGAQSERVPHVLPKLSGVNTYEIPKSQHFPMVDNPEDFYQTLARAIMEA